MLRVSPLVSLILACGLAPAFGQFQTVLVNSQGATAPCTGIGPVGGPAAKKCVEMFQQAGFIRTDEVGYTGLAIGVTGKDDAVIAAIQSESAAQSGLEAGDAITAVDGRSVKPTPGRIATKAVFGRVARHSPQGAARRRGVGDKLDALPQNAPQGPKSPNFFLMVRPMIDWRGEFIPCRAQDRPPR